MEDNGEAGLLPLCSALILHYQFQASGGFQETLVLKH